MEFVITLLHGLSEIKFTLLAVTERQLCFAALSVPAFFLVLILNEVRKFHTNQK
jgi:hypothetical protein